MRTLFLYPISLLFPRRAITTGNGSAHSPALVLQSVAALVGTALFGDLVQDYARASA